MILPGMVMGIPDMNNIVSRRQMEVLVVNDVVNYGKRKY